jgi:hypothetical protein
MFRRKWHQVCICECGFITKVNKDRFQKCGGCKLSLSNYHVKKTFRYARMRNGAWSLKV